MRPVADIALELCPFAEREWHRDDCACCKRIRAAIVHAYINGVRDGADSAVNSCDTGCWITEEEVERLRRQVES